jgi:hypothetical protein
VRTLAATALAGLVLGATPAAQAAWHQPIGGASPINETPTTDARQPSLASIGGVPYVAWTEVNGAGKYQVRVARLRADGTAWEKVGDSTPINYDTAQDASSAVITGFDGVPYVAWEETDPNFPNAGAANGGIIHVARLDAAGTGWERVPAGEAPINVDPTHPALGGLSLRQIDKELYLGWSEQAACTGMGCSPLFNVHIARLNATGDGWDLVGGPVDATAGDQTALPDIADVGGVPWVTFVETNANFSAALEVRVVKLDPGGNVWEQVGTGPQPINASGSAMDPPSLADINGEPYVAWDEQSSSPSQLYVKRLNAPGDGWEPAPTTVSLNHDSGQSAQGSTLVGIGPTPYIAWVEANSSGGRQVRVQRLKADGSGWEELVGGDQPINMSLTDQADSPPGFDAVGGFPWVAWAEPGASAKQIRVSRLEPDFSNVFAEPQSNIATLLSGVTTYGLPYPLGFEYGPDASFSSSTSPTVSSSDTTAFFQQITALAPSTFYEARPFATAGVAAPRVEGPSAPFVTFASASGTSTTPTAPATGPATLPFKLLIVIVKVPTTIVKGHGLRIRYLLTDDAVVTLEVTGLGSARGASRARVVVSTKSGVHNIVWNGRLHGRPAAPGRYRLTLTAKSPDGQRASDTATLVVTHMHRSRRR